MPTPMGESLCHLQRIDVIPVPSPYYTSLFYVPIFRYDDDAPTRDSDDEQQDKPKEDTEETKADPEQEEEEEDQVQETRIDVEVPKISTNLGSDIHFVKLPNFLSIDCRPFDAETYDDEIGK